MKISRNSAYTKIRLHRCWRRMLETKYVGDNFEMLVTVLAHFVTNILFLLLLASGTNIEKMSPISKFCHQHKVTNIKSPTSTCHQHRLVTNIYVAQRPLERKLKNLSQKEYKLISCHGLSSVLFFIRYSILER